jgi:hypothetical protein
MLLAEQSYVTKRSRSNNVPTVPAQSSCENRIEKKLVQFKAMNVP